MHKVTFTHAGWFGFCPVLANFDDPEAPMIEPRHWSLQPLFWLSEHFEHARILVQSVIDPESDPMFMLRLAELPRPVVKSFAP